MNAEEHRKIADRLTELEEATGAKWHSTYGRRFHMQIPLLTVSVRVLDDGFHGEIAADSFSIPIHEKTTEDSDYTLVDFALELIEGAREPLEGLASALPEVPR